MVNNYMYSAEPRKHKKLWKIPVVWRCWGIVQVEADTRDEACAEAMDVPLLPHGEYMDDSFDIDYDGIDYYNPPPQESIFDE